MIYKYVSVYTIVDKIYRDYDHNEELDVFDLIEWAGEALEFIGAGQQYEERVAELEIKNNMAALPCNFHNDPMVSFNGNPMDYADGYFSPMENNSSDGKNYVNAKEVSEDTFPTSGNVGDRANSSRLKETFYIKDGVLVTSLNEGTVLLAYNGIKVDKDGYPMIPDHISYKTAIAKYCQMMLDIRDARRNRITKDWAQKSEQDWHWYCKQARGAANMPNVAKAESIKNQWVKLKPNQNTYGTFFADKSIREMKKLK